MDLNIGKDSLLLQNIRLPDSQSVMSFFCLKDFILSDFQVTFLVGVYAGIYSDQHYKVSMC